MIGAVGYMKDRDGPCGWRKFTVTMLLSSLTCRTHTTHHLSSCTHATKSLMSSNASSHSKTETRSSFKVVDSEYAFVETAALVRGINECSFLVPGMVCDSLNLSSSNCSSFCSLHNCSS